MFFMLHVVYLEHSDGQSSDPYLQSLCFIAVLWAWQLYRRKGLSPQDDLVTDEVLSKVMKETHSATMLADVLHRKHKATIPTLPIPILTNFITPQYNIYR
jgi:hypothetical protein